MFLILLGETLTDSMGFCQDGHGESLGTSVMMARELAFVLSLRQLNRDDKRLRSQLDHGRLAVDHTPFWNCQASDPI